MPPLYTDKYFANTHVNFTPLYKFILWFERFELAI